jgi:Domain of unknown function (DUF4062)
VGKRVFMSSVTTEFRPERTALSGLIRALAMDPVRFEDFTSLPEPSREVCLRAVDTSDVYLLLLGAYYGTPFPDTGLSPTHEEYRAALNKGIPRLAFRRRGVTMEPAQQRFAEEVEAYQTGLFRGAWEEIGELLNAVSEALSNLDALTGQLVFTPLGQPVGVGWLTTPDRRDPFSGLGQSALEVYLTPRGAVITGARLRTAGDAAARLLRELGGVGQNEAIDVSPRSDEGAVARAVRPPRRRSFNEDLFGGHVEGVAVARNGEVCAWASLRRDHFGSVVDASCLAETAAPLVFLAGRLLEEIVGDTSVRSCPASQ